MLPHDKPPGSSRIWTRLDGRQADNASPARVGACPHVSVPIAPKGQFYESMQPRDIIRASRCWLSRLGPEAGPAKPAKERGVLVRNYNWGTPDTHGTSYWGSHKQWLDKDMPGRNG